MFVVRAFYRVRFTSDIQFCKKLLTMRKFFRSRRPMLRYNYFKMLATYPASIESKKSIFRLPSPKNSLIERNYFVRLSPQSPASSLIHTIPPLQIPAKASIIPRSFLDIILTAKRTLSSSEESQGLLLPREENSRPGRD